MSEISDSTDKLLIFGTTLRDKTSWDCYVNDDSSSLGYGSGGSTSWSSASGDQDFYKIDRVAAEFYDLDSVHNFCSSSSTSCSHDDECPYCLPRSKQSPPNESSTLDLKPDGECCDIDEVQPSDQLLSTIAQRNRLRSSRCSERTVADLKISNNKKEELYLCVNSYECRIENFRKSIDSNAMSKHMNRSQGDAGEVADDHIYEEIHYDSSNVDIAFIQPPPLPIRNANMIANKSFNSLHRSRRLLFDSRGRIVICDEQKTHL